VDNCVENKAKYYRTFRACGVGSYRKEVRGEKGRKKNGGRKRERLKIEIGKLEK
jgi:hypothetical protein